MTFDCGKPVCNLYPAHFAESLASVQYMRPEDRPAEIDRITDTLVELELARPRSDDSRSDEWAAVKRNGWGWR